MTEGRHTWRQEFAFLGTCQALDSGQLSPMFEVLGWVPKPDELMWVWNLPVGLSPALEEHGCYDSFPQTEERQDGAEEAE